MKYSLVVLIFVLVFSVLCFSQTTWTNQNSGTSSILQSVYFFDQNNGWISGAGPILHTTDGGATWTTQNTPPLSGFYVSIYFTDAMNGWACGNEARIIHTTDGGNTWVTQPNPYTYPNPILYDIYFANADTGWAVGGDHGSFPSYIYHRVILYTTNGGNTWSYQMNSSQLAPLFCISFISNTEAYAAAESGDVIHTSNGGTTWATRGQVSGRTYSIYFINSMTGWVCGEDLTVSHYSTISKTTDGGYTWDTQSFGASEYIQDLAFTDGNTGWAVGGTIGGSGGNQHTTILHTSDGGANWQMQNPPSISTLLGVNFVDINNGWAVGADGTVLSTSTPVSIQQASASSSPSGFTLYQNYPNPFNPTTNIGFNLPVRTSVSMVLYNSIGEEVKDLLNAEMGSGYHEITVDALDIPSGIYYYKLQADGFSQTKKMLLLK